MSIIRERIRHNDNDIKIKFKLDTNNQFIGKQQEINKLTQFSTLDVLNPPVDEEKTRFRFSSTNTSTISFQFFRSFDAEFINSFVLTMFSVDEVLKKNEKTDNSFFIMDFYDSFDTYSQNKIFSTYLTKIVNRVNTDDINMLFLSYPLFDPKNQWNKIYIPNWFLDKQSTNEFIGYSKFSFYNAKTGKLIPFFNLENNNLTTPEKYYIKTVINVRQRTYIFQTPNLNNIIFREIREINNPQYVNKVNNTVDNFENLRLAYPTGNTFNANIRGYEIT